MAIGKSTAFEYPEKQYVRETSPTNLKPIPTAAIAGAVAFILFKKL
jgi:hypothetical protein